MGTSERIGISAVKVLFEFTKDLSAEEARALKEALPRTETKDKRLTVIPGTLQFCFFDEDGVLLLKVGGEMKNNHARYYVAGELTGKKGDVIRFHLGPIANISRGSVAVNALGRIIRAPERAKKISKVELRPQPLPKDK
jgi:hypothetical protein